MLDLSLIPIYHFLIAGLDTEKGSLSTALSLSLFFSFFFFFVFLGLHLRQMEVPRLGVELELQLQAYTIATAPWDVSHVCNLHHSSQQYQIPNH